VPTPDIAIFVQAQARTPTDPDVRSCWSFIVQGLELGWLDRDELVELIEHLRQQRDFGVEELLFAHLGDRLRVSLLDDSATCSPVAMCEELTALLAEVTAAG
jgi:hypothetical protein